MSLQKIKRRSSNGGNKGQKNYIRHKRYKIYYIFDNSHSDWCEVISHCSFDLHFPDDY